MYADTITDSMRLSIQDTNRRREKQLYYNATHAVMPKQAIKSGTKIMSGESLGANYTLGVQGLDAAADPVAAYMDRPRYRCGDPLGPRSDGKCGARPRLYPLRPVIATRCTRCRNGRK